MEPYKSFFDRHSNWFCDNNLSTDKSASWPCKERSVNRKTDESINELVKSSDELLKMNERTLEKLIGPPKK
jgi:hypothetical protein